MVWNNISELAKRQREKWLSKNGITLEQNEDEVLARINHLQEELIDALIYCEWLKEALGGGGKSNMEDAP